MVCTMPSILQNTPTKTTPKQISIKVSTTCFVGIFAENTNEQKRQLHFTTTRNGKTVTHGRDHLYWCGRAKVKHSLRDGGFPQAAAENLRGRRVVLEKDCADVPVALRHDLIVRKVLLQ